MTPILYPANAENYNNNGFGVLTDTISAAVTEGRNDLYELELSYPVTGIHYGDIKNDCVVKVKANEKSGLQLFRIYNISRPLAGIITVSAEHISYQLNYIPVSPFALPQANAASAMQMLKVKSAVTNPFEFWSDIDTNSAFTVEIPIKLRTMLGGTAGSVLDKFGGEYEWDNYTVKLHKARGSSNGVRIAYGKNLIDLKQEENIASMVTGVYPYWADADGNMVELPERVVVIKSDYAYPRVEVLDLSQEFEEKPTAEQLRTAAESYVLGTELNKPKVSITVNFTSLWGTSGYGEVAALERLSLCDTAIIQFPALGVDATAKVIKVVYDVLLERYTSLELGDAKPSIANTIKEQTAEIQSQKTVLQAQTEDIKKQTDQIDEQGRLLDEHGQVIVDQGEELKKQQNAISALPDKDFLEKAIEDSTNAITGQAGGYIVLNPPKNPQEILVMDTPDIKTAIHVWRWNQAGLGYSKNGYNGPYETAITAKGEIVADFIKTGVFMADLIKAGVLQSQNGVMYISMETGVIRSMNEFCNASMDSGSFVLRSSAGKEIGWFGVDPSSETASRTLLKSSIVSAQQIAIVDTAGNHLGGLQVDGGKASLRFDKITAGDGENLLFYSNIDMQERSIGNVANVYAKYAFALQSDNGDEIAAFYRNTQNKGVVQAEMMVVNSIKYAGASVYPHRTTLNGVQMDIMVWAG